MEADKINNRKEQWRKTQSRINLIDKAEGGALSPEVRHKKTGDELSQLI